MTSLIWNTFEHGNTVGDVRKALSVGTFGFRSEKNRNLGDSDKREIEVIIMAALLVRTTGHWSASLHGPVAAINMEYFEMLVGACGEYSFVSI